MKREKRQGPVYRQAPELEKRKGVRYCTTYCEIYSYFLVTIIPQRSGLSGGEALKSSYE